MRRDISAIPVEFNAWRFEKEPQLLVPLLDTIRTALVTWSNQRNNAALRERVASVARRIGKVVLALLSGLSSEVGLPGGAVKVKYDAGKATEALLITHDDAEKPQSLYVGAFQELSEAFQELSQGGTTRVVVFVDDLDRCLPSNALDVLESMKLFFDLPGFIFVVGLDEEVVQRAVRTRFRDPFSQTQQDDLTPALRMADRQRAEQLERSYVEKLFQVPYRMPPMLFHEQLTELLETMYKEAELSEEQLLDFQQRVTPHVQRIGTEQRINPREVKRFLNTYTLQTLIRPKLDRDIILPLQALYFKYDWRKLYDAIITDSILFSDALGRFRDGDASAFEDLAPELRQIPADLGQYPRSGYFTELCTVRLDPYISSLESASSHSGGSARISDGYRAIGKLRGEVRRIRATQSPTQEDAQQLSSVALEARSVLLYAAGSHDTRSGRPFLSDLLNDLETATATLISTTSDAQNNKPAELKSYIDKVDDLTNAIYRELRVGSDLAAQPLP